MGYIINYRLRQNKTPQQKNRNFSEKHEYLFHKILLICSTYNSPQVFCFMLYLLDVRRNDGNLNLKNDFATEQTLIFIIARQHTDARY